MISNNDFVSVDNYVATLLSPSKLIDTDFDEEDFEALVDDVYIDSVNVKKEHKALSVSTYLSFTINNMTYIVPYSHVNTVKRIYEQGGYDTFQILDVSHILGQGGTVDGQFKFAVFLKGCTDFIIAVDSINSAVEISNEEIKLRRSVDSRPWLLGVSAGQACLLLDTYALGSVLAVARQRLEYGTKTAMV